MGWTNLSSSVPCRQERSGHGCLHKEVLLISVPSYPQTSSQRMRNPMRLPSHTWALLLVQEGNRQGHSKGHCVPSTAGKLSREKQNKKTPNPKNPMSQCKANQDSWASLSVLKCSFQIHVYDITFSSENGFPHSVKN